MKTYRKKTTIQAVQINSFDDALRQFGSEDVATLTGTWDWTVWDKLHDTWVKANFGDWIAVGAEGELYPIVDEVFQKTYEEATG